MREALVKEFLREAAGFGFYNVVSSLRAPDVAQTEGLKWALTAFIRKCVLDQSFTGFFAFRDRSLSQSDISSLVTDLQVLLQEAAERPSIWVRGIKHYLDHASRALVALEKRRSLSDMERWEAGSLRRLIIIIETRFQLVCFRGEPLCYALPALEDTISAWYEIYSKRWEITPG